MVGMQTLEDRNLMAANSFGDFQSTQQTVETRIGLLLPAVQKGAPDGLDLNFDLTNGTPGGGTFLPAVQKVREPAAGIETNLLSLELATIEPEPNSLLLPAVQKERQPANWRPTVETDHAFETGNENQIIAILIGL